MPKEASFYIREGEEKIHCQLCPHHCRISPGNVGFCGVRKNEGGTLICLNYGHAVAANADPIEKKPLFHFLPGTDAYSIATVGCNMRCDHCQNYHISQVRGNVRGERLEPSEVVDRAGKTGCSTIAYTYTEPTIFYEYARDTARLGEEEGLANVFVTNGYIEEEPLRDISPVLDAANVDLKSFSDDFYREVAGASLEPVLRTIRLMVELDIWVEVTTLFIPGLNDSEDEMRKIAEFIAEVDPSIPWHISRFRPAHNMTDRAPTPVEKMRKAKEIGEEEGLRFIYHGNVPGKGESTYCPECGEEIISRFGFSVQSKRLQDERCPDCGEEIEGVWSR